MHCVICYDLTFNVFKFCAFLDTMSRITKHSFENASQNFYFLLQLWAETEIFAKKLKILYTRMHSSRMRTVRCSNRLLGVSVRGGVGGSARRGCLPRGCLPGGWGVCLGGRCLPAGCLPRGCLPMGGVCQTPLYEQNDRHL